LIDHEGIVECSLLRRKLRTGHERRRFGDMFHVEHGSVAENWPLPQISQKYVSRETFVSEERKG
jgi:hypothetical protein